MESIEDTIFNTTDTRLLRSKWRSHCGNISRIKTYYKSVEDKPIQQQQAKEIKRCLSALDENTRIFGVLQDQLESLEPELPATEAEELATQHTLSISLRAELEALLQASQAWTLGARIKNTVVAIDKAPSLSGPVYSVKCECLRRDHDTILSYTECLSYTELQVIKGELAPLIQSLEARLNQEVVDSTLSPSPTLSS